MMQNLNVSLAALVLIALVCGCSEDSAINAPVRNNAEAPPVKLPPSSSPAERQVFFGDLHLHTGRSFDAASASVTTTPEMAYRFARGESVAYFGRQVQRQTPLDFLAVTDHAEYLGIASMASDSQGYFADTEWPETLAQKQGDMIGFLRVFSPSGFRGGPPVEEFIDEGLIESIWQNQVSIAEQFYSPGVFTSFVAFEWSPMPGGAHIHRNVIFKGPEYPQRPFSTIDSMLPEDLWSYAEIQKGNGMDVLLIPHNSNLSQGLMFALQDSYEQEFDAAYSHRRSELERLVEITQIKGSSETRPEFSPEDEFAGFELINWDNGELADLRGGYVRPAYKRSLQIQSRTGENPFRFGLVGSSDFHSGLSATEEYNYPGGLGSSDEQSDPQSVLTSVNPLMGSPTTVMSASGLTGVWAEENTRESLFDAMYRREVFATSGSRIKLRMFAGWQLNEVSLAEPGWVQTAYSLGVPMGSELPSQSVAGESPDFILQAIKDADSGNLDRIQIIKVWLENGEAREKIFEVVWSGDRQPDSLTGKLPVIGNSVDITTASYSNSIGSAELLGIWQDPEFSPVQPALYYARVIEIPTPRWSTYLAVDNAQPVPSDVPVTIQERAWSSPVWYTPAGK